MFTLLGIAFFWSAGAFALEAYGRRTLSPEARWQAIVVLGCRVRADGRPSVALALRVRRAAELYHAGHAPLIVMTGGVGDSGFQESAVAARLATQLGVPEDAIRIEGISTSTEENARYAAQVSHAEQVLVVTDAYHVLRAERVLRRYFTQVRGVGTLNPYWQPRVQGAFREVLALAAYGLLGRLSRPDGPGQSG